MQWTNSSGTPKRWPLNRGLIPHSFRLGTLVTGGLIGGRLMEVRL